MGHLKDVTSARHVRVAGMLLLAGLLTAAGALFFSPFGPKRYSAPEASFRVVGSNGQPIPGAIALMSWSYMENTHVSRVFDVMEVEADSDGVIRVPSWRPIITPFGTRMLSYMPYLRVFKPGYIPIFDQNVTGEYWEEAPPSMPLKWDGKTIVLESADQRSQSYLNQARALAGSMLFFNDPKQCWSMRFHGMIDAVNAELEVLTPPDTPSGKVAPRQSGCTSSK